MRRIRMGLLCLAAGLTGCASGQSSIRDSRPPTTPAPVDVQAEIRDARFFLAYPDQSIGPDPGIRPKQAVRSNGSR